MIATRTREEINKAIGELLRTHWPEIDASYVRAEEGISLGFTVKISPVASGVHMVKTGISFVADRVKDEIGCKVNEEQEALFMTVTKGKKKGMSNVRNYSPGY